MKRLPAVAFAAAVCATVGSPDRALAVPVEKWVQTSQADFDTGQAKGVSILSLGQLALAPEFKPLLSDPVPHIWALAVDQKGALYAATGTEPKLLRLSGGKAETFFTSPVKTDIEVLAVAVAADGAVYASAAPSGSIYRIGPDGKAEAVHKGDDPYVWALAVAPDGTLYAGTGPNGKVLKLPPKGKAATLLSTGSRHVLCLLLAPDGGLYAGTDKDGLLYHVNAKGEGRLLYDAEEADIRAMAFNAQGNLFFATAGPARTTAASTMPSEPAPPPTGMRSFTMRGQDNPDGGGPSVSTMRDMPSPPSTPSPRPTGSNAIYRLMPDGDVVRVVSIGGASFYSLLWHKDKLYAGTGNDGRLHCIEGNRISRLADFDDSQITALAVAGGRIVLATANSGRVQELAADHIATGTFTSQVHDSNAHSRWGVANWAARIPSGASVTLATRSGNSSSPDDTWSAWSSELSRADADQIISPAARFIQYRATLKADKAGASPVLDEVIVSYAQSNRRPVISQVQLMKVPKPRRPLPMPPQPIGGMPLGQPSPMPSIPPGDKQPPSPRGPFADLVRVTWQASDPNKDELTYFVYFRGEDEANWKKLEERLNTTFHDWDTHAVPDGPYRIRVIASDAPTNPPDHAQLGEKITDAFIIDNTPPAIAGLAARIEKDRAVIVTAKCSDAGSGLADGEVSIDGADWVKVTPMDGIFDSQGEALSLRIRELPKGEHTIVVRVKDLADNTGAAKCIIKIE